MAKRKAVKEKVPDKALVKAERALSGYDKILSDVVELLESARHASARAVNALMTATYWEIGRRIVEHEQGGEKRAEYGEILLERLAVDLKAKFGRGFGRENLRLMRSFYLTYAASQISQTVSGKSQNRHSQLITGKFDVAEIAVRFPLPWSHYVRLMSVKNAEARKFYEAEDLRGGWSIRQLKRQIDSMFYERAALSRNKAAIMQKGEKAKPEDQVTAEEEIKEPFVLEFLGLKDEYSESDLEEALIKNLEGFLLELGGDFAFIGRQRRLRIGNQWFRVDLLFFHRRLRCLVVIDLKLGEFSHADAGQMNLYLNYAREHWMNNDENPPVGLILCAEKETEVAHYALNNLQNKILAAEYKTLLPDEKILVAEMKRTRKQLENQAKRGQQ